VSKSAREMAKKAQTTAAEQARVTVIPAVTGAAQQAKEKLGPRLETTKARVTPALEELGPALSAALAAAATASEPYRDEAKRRGDAAVAALRGEVEPPKSKHRIRKLLMVLGVGAAVAAAYKWFKSREAADEWEQAYQPTSARAVPDSDVSAGGERPGESLFSDKAAEGAASANKVPDPVEAVEESTTITPPEHTVETVTGEAEGDTGTAPAASSDGAAAKSAPKPRTRRKRTT
jgi:hypothetical protein